MSRKNWWVLGIIVSLLLIITLGGTTWYFATLPERVSQHETIVLGQSTFVPGTEAALRVVVRDSSSGAPLEDSLVRVATSGGETLFEGTTNELGTADVRVQLPDEEGSETLVFETESALGSDEFERTVTLQRDYKILLTTDKPLYQPGQIIHIRALALSTFDRQAAQGQPLEIIVADAKGNKVFRETFETGEFGVASVDFQLATEVNTGNFNISATIGNTTSEKTVVVENYALPKFDLNIETERDFYAPGETVNASLNATYFFGKPVSESEINIEGFTFDFEQQTQFELQGVTDAEGNFDFSFELPSFIAGSEFEQGLGRFYLTVSVTDQAASTETKSASLAVAEQPLIIEAIPEGGRFRPGLENLLYVLVSYPDGSPAAADLQIDTYYDGQTRTASTGQYGIAAVPMTPNDSYQELFILARDAQGNESGRDFFFEGTYENEYILLRPDRAAYRVGETLEATIFTTAQSGSVYLDIIRDGQTISTRALEIESGQTPVAVDLTPDLYGTLTLNAYQIQRSGHVVRDSRLVIVDQADELAITFDADQDEYRPGETANMNINVSDAAGTGQEAAVGLAIVDEAVFALAEQDPGFAKLYFLLEAELLEPKFELRGFSVPDFYEPIPFEEPELAAAVNEAAQANLAAATQPVAFGLEANSREENLSIINDRQDQYFSGLSAGSFWAMAALGAIMLLVSGVYAWREKVLGRSLLITLGLLVAGVILLMALGFLFSEFYWIDDDTVILAFLGVALLSLLGTIIYAVRRKDGSMGWLIGLLAGIVALGFLAAYAFEWAFADPPFTAVIILLVGTVVGWLLKSATFFAKRQVFMAIISSIITLPLIGVSALGVMASGFAGGMMQPQVVEMVMEVEETAAMEADFERGAEPQAAAGENAGQGEGPRLRQFFPETMFWLPEGQTDAAGNLNLDIPVADSITTWRLTALASTQDGQLGSATGSLRVFQDFFIDLNLPRALTQGDEVSIPVGVFNYLPEAQTVRLEVQQESWFTLLDDPVKEIEIAGNDISVVYFRIAADQFGTHGFEVTAIGSQLSDAIRKPLRVFPDGKELRFSESDRLSAENPLNTTVTIPQDAVPGTQNLTVKIYPGLVSQVVEGLDSLLQMPYGCFEQTSSTTYPNVLVLDYLQTSQQISPEVQFKAEEYINLGYQRLTTFEVSRGGGFSLFGDPPPDPMLTAYGLQEFHDMSQVYNVDPDLIARTAEWIMSQQEGDGSWSSSSGFRESQLTNQIEKIPVTAYVIWGLADAGFAEDGRVQRGVEFLRENISGANDAYQLALVANAFVAFDNARQQDLQPATQEVLERLAAMATVEGDTVFWGTELDTVMGSYGDVGNIETTALATLAFVRANNFRPDIAQGGLNYLIQNKDSFGNWHTTQTTILSLKTFLEVARRASEDVDAVVTVTLNGSQQRTVEITPENFDVVQLIQFDDINLGDNVVDIQVEGEGNLMYQIAGSYYLDWEILPEYPDLVEEQLVNIDVAYDRTELAVNDEVTVSVDVTLAEGTAEWAIVDLGIPPGFAVNTEDLTVLVEQSNLIPEETSEGPVTRFEKFETTGRQLTVYLGDLTSDKTYSFSYRMTASYPLRAQTPSSSAYDYYNPAVQGEEQPLTLVVTES